MIATDIASPFFAPFKLSLVLAFFLSAPLWLYQVWSFIAPGLYTQEKRLATPILISSVLLFYLGMAFCYFVVFPIVIKHSPIAVIYIDSCKAQALSISDSQLSLLKTLRNQAILAIKNLS